MVPDVADVAAGKLITLRNEVTVDTLTLLGMNDVPQGFAIDHANELVFFHDATTKLFRSVSLDLVSNFKTEGTWPTRRGTYTTRA